MSLNYNFAFKNSKLKRWERPKPKNILASKKTNKEKIQFLYQTLKSNSLLLYPSGIIIIITIAIKLINIYPANLVNRLESKHIEYEALTRKLSKLQSQVKSMRRYSDSIRDFYLQPLPTYLFTYYLQKSVPKDVQLKNYFISNNDFLIEASSYELESLNEMTTLLLNSPIINRDSLSIERINKDIAVGKTNFIFEITGKTLKLNQEKRIILYKEASAFGLLEKITRFKTFHELIH